MGFFTTRERTELSKVTEVEGEIRNFVREQGAQADPQRVAGRLASLINRVAGSSIQEIDTVTAELQALRGQLQAQGERVRDVIVQYATLSQSAAQSTKIILENLAQWRMGAEAAAAERRTMAPLAPSDTPDEGSDEPSKG